MGWNPFKSKTETRTSVSTSVSRVVQDNLVPNATKSGVLSDIIRGDGQMVESVLDNLVGSIAFKSERMYRWAKKNYINGVPTRHFVNNQTGGSVVKYILNSLTGASVTLDYYEYTSLNTMHYGWQKLYDSYRYVHETNEIRNLTIAKGYKVYLVDMVAVIPLSVFNTMDQNTLVQWGTSPSSGYTPLRPYSNYTTAKRLGLGSKMSYVADSSATEEYIKVKYGWYNTVTKKYIEEELIIPISFTQEEQFISHFQAKYSYSVTTTTVAGVKREAYIDSDTFQLIPTEYYYTSNTTHYSGYFTYRDGSGEYPELDAVFSLEYNDLGSFFPIVHFRSDKVDLTQNKTTEEYRDTKKLLKYFSMDYDSVSAAIHANPDIGDVQQAMMIMGVPSSGNSPVECRYLYEFFLRAYVEGGRIAIGESALGSPASIAVGDRRFGMVVSYNGISRVRKLGTIGKVGSYRVSSGSKTISQSKSVSVFNWESGQNEITTSSWNETIPYFAYRKQISNGVYEEIRVFNLIVTYQVYGSHTTTTNLIPVDYSVVSDFPPQVRETLYARSLHFVFNAVVTQEIKTKWYQTGFFKAVLIIIAIVWTVWSMGSDGGSGLAAAVAATGYAGAALLIIINVVINLLIGFAISMVVSFVVKKVGGDVARILAVVAVVLAAYYGYQGGATNMQYAGNLITVSNNLVQASFKEDILDLTKEYELFNIEKDIKVKELEEVSKLLEHSTYLSPIVIWGENPQDFYNRTVHSGNIGVLCFDQLHDFVDNSLRLPDINETLGMQFGV